ncbi:MAG: histidine kinase [Candidatus Eisenbacteria bacterium]
MRSAWPYLVGALGAAMIEAAYLPIAHASWPRHDSFWRALVGVLPPWILVLALSPVVIWLANRLPPERRGWPSNVVVHLAAALGFSVAHFLLLAEYHALRVDSFGPVLPRAWALLDEYFMQDLACYAAIVAFARAREHRASSRRRALREREARAQIAEARLTALRGQLAPHFLFNVLNTISMLIRQGERTQAIETLTDLSELLRLVLREGASDQTTLGSELGIVRRYLALAARRFGDRLSVSIVAPIELEPACVPGLVLQPLVENAIRHGVAHSLGAHRLVVEASSHGEQLHLEVLDEGARPKVDLEPSEPGSGLRTLRERLDHLHGAGASCGIDRLPDGGTRAWVQLPLVIA